VRPELWLELREFDRDHISLLEGVTDQLGGIPKIAWQIVISDLPRCVVIHVRVTSCHRPLNVEAMERGKGTESGEARTRKGVCRRVLLVDQETRAMSWTKWGPCSAVRLLAP
jgi:hypothetical protein